MGSSPIVRPARVEDIVQMARVHVRCWQETYRGLMSDAVLDDPDFPAARERMWTAVLTDDRYRQNRAAVAIRDNELIGIAMSGPPEDVTAAWTSQLYVLYVYAADHGTGAGLELLEAVIDRTESAALWVADPNPRAQAFYRKHGFVPDGTAQVEDGVREIRMVRLANPGRFQARPAGRHGRYVPAGEELSRSFYASLGAEGLRRRTRPQWDAAITDLVAGYLGQRERVLDVGCGYGRVAIPLTARRYQVTGLDHSEPLLRSGRTEAHAQGVRLPLAAGSMSRLPFADESFDSVICLWSAFYEVLDPADQVQALAGLCRVLRRGGLALIEGPLPPGPDDELPADRIFRGLVEGLPNPHFLHDAETLESLCRAAGISGAEIFVREWAGRDRTLLIFRRPR